MNMDPRTLLTLLQQDDDRTVQRFALERLSIIVVTSDSVERCFYAYPPWIFMPALCRIFLDEYAPDDVLELTVHVIVYYLEVSAADCTQWIVAVDGAVKAFFSRLEVVDVNNRKRRDFAEQCVEVLELTCTRQSGAVLKACGDFSWVLPIILNSGYLGHNDILHSAMFVVSRLCGKMEPHDSRIESGVEALSILFKHEDHQVSDAALRCFVSLADRFMRRGVDPAPLAEHGLTAELVSRLGAAGGLAPGQSSTGTPQPSCGAPPAITSTPGSGFSSQVSTIVSLLSALFRGSPIVTRNLLRTPLLDAIERAVQGDDRCCLDTMRLVDLLLVLIFEGREALPRCTTSSAHGIPALQRLHSSGERSHRQLIDCIKRKDTDGLIDAIDTGAFDVNFMDDVGETLLIWASAFGTQEMNVAVLLSSLGTGNEVQGHPIIYIGPAYDHSSSSIINETQSIMGYYERINYSVAIIADFVVEKWKNMEQLTDIIDEHVLKPTKACGTRWIGHRLLAVKALDRDYKTLRMLFDDLGSGEREDTTATVSATMKGRIKDLKTHKFALYLAVYQDLLQELSVLSNRFQAEDIPITSVRASVEVAALALKAQLETPGTHVQKFEREVQEANTDSDTEDGDNQTKRLKYRDLELYGPRVPSVGEFQAGPLKTVVDKVIDCLDKRFNELYENGVLIAFEVFDPSNMPKGKDTLAAYGNAK
uniref:E3 ubiquitin-protein ligase HECTD1-like n=1 Tax=Myxine glutinosa TaxID=7769 RepID=UPI00358E9702